MSNALSRPGAPNTVPSLSGQDSKAGSKDAKTRMAEAQAASRAMTPPQRAAVIIALLGPENAGPIIEQIEDRHLRAFYDSYENLSRIPREVLYAIVADFVSELKNLQGTLKGGPDEARELSAQLFDSERTTRIFGKDFNAKPKADIWLRLAKEKPGDLAAFFATQRPQVICIVLGQLPNELAGEILGELPDEITPEVVRRLSKPVKLDESTLKIIGEVMEREYFAEDDVVDTGGENPLAAVSSILSVLPTYKRETILEFLSEREPEEAERIRQTMLTFENLPSRISRQAVPVIVRQMEQDKLLMALKLAATNAPETLDFFYANISKRMVEQYQEQVEDLGTVRKKDAEGAQAAMMSLIARLEKEGEIELIRQEIEDGEDEEERI